MGNSSGSLLDKTIDFLKANILVSALFLGGIVFLVIGLIQFVTPHSPEIEFRKGEEVKGSSTSAAEEKIIVDVSGEVQKPGVYTLSSNARIQDLSSTVGSEAWNSRDLKSRPH